MPKPITRIDTSRFLKIDPGIDIITPRYNEAIVSPLKITGRINGLGWVGFEGQVGTVKLVDEKNNVLAEIYLPAKGDWMKLPTDFEAVLEFSAPTSTKLGKLIFKNENASGEAVRDKIFELPIMFK